MRPLTERGPLPVYNWLAHYQAASPRRVDVTIVADAGITHAIVGATSDREARRRASVALSGLDVWFTKSDTERHDLALRVVEAFAARLSKTLARSA